MHPIGATAVKLQFRRFAISKAANASRSYTTSLSTRSSSCAQLKPPSWRESTNPPSRRRFSTSQRMNTSRDSSTIDFAYMPQFTLETAAQQNEILRVPILPSNSTAPGRDNEAVEPVIRPEIATVSANGTHIDSPSAMSEVTDNHAIELSPFDLTNKVTSAATAAAREVTRMSAERLKEPGIVKQLWSGLVDDVLGGRSTVRA